MEMGLKDRVAIIAASSQGMGRATALRFAAEGAHIAICARKADALERAAAEARKQSSGWRRSGPPISLARQFSSIAEHTAGFEKRKNLKWIGVKNPLEPVMNLG